MRVHTRTNGVVTTMELRECPFCGGERVYAMVDLHGEEKAHCPDCGAEAPLPKWIKN